MSLGAQGSQLYSPTASGGIAPQLYSPMASSIARMAGSDIWLRQVILPFGQLEVRGE